MTVDNSVPWNGVYTGAEGTAPHVTRALAYSGAVVVH